MLALSPFTKELPELELKPDANSFLVAAGVKARLLSKDRQFSLSSFACLLIFLPSV